jgi:regulator of CtrA degradation
MEFTMTHQHHELTPILLDALYTESMLLADEARSYFDRDQTGGDLSPEISVAFSCESLKVTTRLMHSIAWLLNQKALRAGELSLSEAISDARDLGYAPASDPYQVDRFPDEARSLIAASEDLYFRLQRFNGKMRTVATDVPEPHNMIERLRASF